MVTNTNVDAINERLKKLFGAREGNQAFRLVFSDDQFEYRKGPFNTFYNSGNSFLRCEDEVKLVPKYSYIRGRWILEAWFPPGLLRHGDLPNNNGTYEPIYIFESSDGKYLEPIYKAVEIIIFFLSNPQPAPSPNELARQDKQAFDNDVKHFEEQMENNNPVLGIKFTEGEAIDIKTEKKDGI